MRLPFSGSYRLTQGFGENPAIYAQFGLKGHNGIDWGLPSGTPVLAMESGTARVLEDLAGYGHYIEVTGRYKIAYAHLQKALIFSGPVNEGQAIGISDNSGFSTAPHLHITVKPIPQNNNNGYFGATDPMPLITGDNMAGFNKINAQAAVKNTYNWIAGIEPTPEQLEYWSNQLVKDANIMDDFEYQVRIGPGMEHQRRAQNYDADVAAAKAQGDPKASAVVAAIKEAIK